MNDMDRLEQTLRSIREQDAGKQAPDFLETRLRAAFREQHARPAGWRWMSALAMTAMIALAVWRLSAPAPVQAPQPAPPVIARAVEPPPAIEPAPVAEPKRPKPRRSRAAGTPASGPQEPAPVEFVSLPYAPPFIAGDPGQVIRVRVPRQSIRSFGLPVNEERLFDRIPADLLVGQDGVARGIRLVTSSEMR